jgi:hypothetical protein
MVQECLHVIEGRAAIELGQTFALLSISAIDGGDLDASYLARRTRVRLTNISTADDANVCHLLLHYLEINPLRHCVLLLFGEMILDYDL